MAWRRLVGDCKEYIRQSTTKLYRGFKGELITIPEEAYLFDFRKPETINNLRLLTDDEFGGQSRGKMTTSRNGRLMFTGNISTMIDDNIPVDHSGFCAIRSKPKYGPFNRLETVDMDFYDCVEIKYRGDGRPYFVNLQTDSIMMLNEFDLFQAFMFTKGGPYWEVERFPFSKFFQSYKGHLQDSQMEFNNVRTMGISISDRKNGPFSLEIEYIKMIHLGHQPQQFKTLKTSRFQLTED